MGVKTGKSVREGGRTLLESPELLDSFCAEWQGEAVRLDGPAPRGLALLAQNCPAQGVCWKRVAASMRGGALVVTRARSRAAPGSPRCAFAGAAPEGAGRRAAVRVGHLEDGRPATSARGASQRGPAGAAHAGRRGVGSGSTRVRVDFWFPGEEYSFRADLGRCLGPRGPMRPPRVWIRPGLAWALGRDARGPAVLRRGNETMEFPGTRLRHGAGAV